MTDDTADGAIERAAQAIRHLAAGEVPEIAIVIGSGLAPMIETMRVDARLNYAALDGFPRPTVSGHAGDLLMAHIGRHPLLVLEGRSHFYEAGDAAGMRVPIRALAAAGCPCLMLTCAAGSLRPEMPTGRLMLIRDHIMFGTGNPLIGARGDARFLDMRDAYDPALRARMRAAADARALRLHEGVYVWFPGPSFETPAEIRAAQILGGDAVGMSTAPETILARHAGMTVLGLAIITNLAAGLETGALSHDQTREQGASVAQEVYDLLEAFLDQAAA